MWVFVIVSFCVLRGITEASKTCNARVFEICPLDTEIIQMAPFSKDQHEKYCDNVLNYFACVQEHRKEFSLDKLCGFPLILGRAEKFLAKKFCKKTPFQKRFLRHASCFDKVRASFSGCQKFAKDKIELYQNNLPTVKDQYEASKRCMLASLRAVCLGRTVLSMCGNEAEKTFVTTLNGLQIMCNYCPESDYHTSYMRTELVMKVTDGNLA